MLQAIKAPFHPAQKCRRRRIFRQGQILARFIARDIRRNVMILSDADIASGFLTARIRTVNVLNASRHLVSEPPFGSPEPIAVDRL